MPACITPVRLPAPQQQYNKGVFAFLLRRSKSGSTPCLLFACSFLAN